MIDGRILARGVDLGSGFCLTDRIVATAAHVVRDRVAAELTFVTSSGVQVTVEEVELDPRIDTALLRVAESLAVVPFLAHARELSGWKVTARPAGAAVQLTGSVSAIDHLVTNVGGHDMTVLQLQVREELRDYGGYSGSAVTVEDAVVGILVEQVPERAVHAPAMRPLATNVLYAIPVDRVVARFKLGIEVQGPSGPPPVHQLLDTAYFDLDRLKTAILATKSASDSRLLAFGVEGTDMKVVTNLRAWLPPYIGAVAPKGQIALRPEIVSLDTAVKYVTRYVTELDRINVVCPVLVDGVPSQLVADLVDRVHQVCEHLQRWLVLFFAGEPAGGYPSTVTALPRPSFGNREIDTWARHVVAYRRWPSPLAKAWSDDIVKRASMDDGLDVRLTYEVLEDFIARVRSEPAELRTYLEDLEARC